MKSFFAPTQNLPDNPLQKCSGLHRVKQPAAMKDANGCYEECNRLHFFHRFAGYRAALPIFRKKTLTLRHWRVHSCPFRREDSSCISRWIIWLKNNWKLKNSRKQPLKSLPANGKAEAILNPRTCSSSRRAWTRICLNLSGRATVLCLLPVRNFSESDCVARLFQLYAELNASKGGK